MRRDVTLRLTLCLAIALATGLAVETGAQTPKPGGQVVFGLPWQPVILNPVVESDGVSYLVNLWLYDSLIRIDRNLQPAPELAESWQVSSDGRTWTLTLKKGVTWHDIYRSVKQVWIEK